jgi:hypothetical protein
MAGRRRSAAVGRRKRRACTVRQDRRHAGAEHRQADQEITARARQALQDRQMTVFVYVNTRKQVGDADHVKVFANVDAAEKSRQPALLDEHRFACPAPASKH